MFREYPHGFEKSGDIDSGPIIWGAGAAATGIGLGASLANGDRETAQDIHLLANMLRWPISIQIHGGKPIKALE